MIPWKEKTIILKRTQRARGDKTLNSAWFCVSPNSICFSWLLIYTINIFGLLFITVKFEFKVSFHFTFQR